jgi:hypothetical protein
MGVRVIGTISWPSTGSDASPIQPRRDVGARPHAAPGMLGLSLATESAFGFGASTHPRAPNSAGAKIACSIDVARRQRTNLTVSSLACLSAAQPSHWTNTGAQSQLGAWTALILANGWSATVSHSTGRIIRTACTIRSLLYRRRSR